MTTVGSTTLTKIEHHENHKLTLTKDAGAAIVEGQPCKLNAAGDFIPWTKSDFVHNMIGFAVMDAAQGQEVTVWSRGYGIIMGVSNATQDAGPVTYEGLQTTGMYTNFGKFGVASDTGTTNAIGWALEPATAAGQQIRVVIRD